MHVQRLMELAVCLSGEVHTHTSVLALLRGLRLLCQAGVQPSGRLGIVAVGAQSGSQ